MQTLDLLSFNQDKQLIFCTEGDILYAFTVEKAINLQNLDNSKNLHSKVSRYEIKIKAVEIMLGFASAAEFKKQVQAQQFVLDLVDFIQDEEDDDEYRQDGKKLLIGRQNSQQFEYFGMSASSDFKDTVYDELYSILKKKVESCAPKESPSKKQKAKQPIQTDDAKIAKIQFIQVSSSKLKAYQFNNRRITKKMQSDTSLFGKDNIKFISSYSIKINKLTQQKNNPALWLGFADANLKEDFNIEECQEKNCVIAMSDTSRIFIQGGFKVFYQRKTGEEMRYFQTKFCVEDVVKVQANLDTGVVTWSNQNGKEYGHYTYEQIKSKDINWVPYIELWQAGDQIEFIKSETNEKKE